MAGDHSKAISAALAANQINEKQATALRKMVGTKQFDAQLANYKSQPRRGKGNTPQQRTSAPAKPQKSSPPKLNVYDTANATPVPVVRPIPPAGFYALGTTHSFTLVAGKGMVILCNLNGNTPCYACLVTFDPDPLAKDAVSHHATLVAPQLWRYDLTEAMGQRAKFTLSDLTAEKDRCGSVYPFVTDQRIGTRGLSYNQTNSFWHGKCDALAADSASSAHGGFALGSFSRFSGTTLPLGAKADVLNPWIHTDVVEASEPANSDSNVVGTSRRKVFFDYIATDMGSTAWTEHRTFQTMVYCLPAAAHNREFTLHADLHYLMRFPASDLNRGAQQPIKLTTDTFLAQQAKAMMERPHTVVAR